MSEEKMTGKLVVVRIRGEVDIRKSIKDSLMMLGLRHANWAVVVDDTPSYRGMINKVKDFVTWGEIEENVLIALLKKWGRKAGDKRLNAEEAKKFAADFLAGKKGFKEAGIKPYFRLHPPTGGHPSEGIKKHISVGGSLGYRGEKINSLLAMMGGLKDGTKK